MRSNGWRTLLSAYLVPPAMLVFISLSCIYFNLLLSFKSPLPLTPKAQRVFMDPTASSLILSSPAFRSVYCEPKGEDGIIDLGLSLRTLQPQVRPPSGTLMGLEGYEEMMNIYPKSLNSMSSMPIPQDCEEGVESKERWSFVKVNMDGVIVGRKVRLLHNGCYSSLAHELEDMFGRQSELGLRLFQTGSDFSLLYKDGEEQWRRVGDVPWKEFTECARRLRIAREMGNGVLMRRI